MKFTQGFEKVAKRALPFLENHKKMDLAGLGLLTAAPVYHGYHGLKDWSSKDPEKSREAKANVALGATELGGLGLLARAVQKSH
jgi:hypothetical protein